MNRLKRIFNESLQMPVLRRLSLLSLICTATASLAGDQVTLDQYLQAVRFNHQGIKASDFLSQSAADKSREADAMTSPQLFGSVQFATDKKPNPLIQYAEARNNQYSIGVAQNTTFGLSGKFTYGFSYSKYLGIPNATIPPFVEGRPSLELSQSLWRNGFGSETRATQEQLRSQLQIGEYSEKFKIKMVMAEAEMTYWRLALANETVETSIETLQRAKKILEWNKRRVGLQLADVGDSLQAQAAVELRELQVQAATDERKAASRAFNALKGLDSEEVKESLPPIEGLQLAKLTQVERVKMREDVQLAQKAQEISELSGKLAQERIKPSVDVFGLVAFNSKELDTVDGITKSFGTEKPTLAIGVKFTAPLNWSMTSEVSRGWIREAQSAELNYQRKVMDQEIEWKDLSTKLEEAKRRLTLVQLIEQTQKKRVENERDRLTRGRTLTLQVLLAEEDYTQSQFNRIRTQTEILQIVARMKTFGELK